MSIANAYTPKHQEKCGHMMTIAMPHLGLYLFLLGYLLCGAWAFLRIEMSADLAMQERKLLMIIDSYRQIGDVVSQELCTDVSDSRTEIKERTYRSISRLSSFMEGRLFELLVDQNPKTEELLPPRWNTMSSILYALSILTTTGYVYAFPITPFGQCCAMAYGMIGIPLMVLAAVDIGRFLSDSVLFAYNKVLQVWHSLVSKCGCCRRTQQVKDIVETKVVKVQEQVRRRSHRTIRTKRRRQQLKRKEKLNEKRLPLAVNASILLLFCTLGGLVYIAAGGNQKTFLEAFFVTFNLVANLTMAEMPTDINHVLTVFYILFFVTFGMGSLAVLSMCADLAASELKWLFIKIHYFGRRIKWKKRRDTKVDDVEVKELLKIIEEIRRKYPNKIQITSSDILQYISELGAHSSELSAIIASAPRRDTIAFMPRSIEALRFADEMDLDESSHRSVSRAEDMGNAVQSSGAGGVFTDADIDFI